jgi:hypothetical protein
VGRYFSLPGRSRGPARSSDRAGGVYFQPFPEAAAGPAPSRLLAAAPTIEPVLDNNISVSVYGRVIPISAGKRRLPGDLIWLKHDQLNTEGQYTANAAYSFGYRLIPVARQPRQSVGQRRQDL